MSRHRLLGLASLPIFIALAVFAIASHSPSTPNSPAGRGSAPTGTLSLITEPSDGITPFINQINSASKSIDLVMYELEDSQVEQALVAAANRGVAVRVLLNQGYYGQQESANVTAYDFLQSNHVPVHWTPKYFALTHQKTLIIDSREAAVMTLNFTPKYYSTSRDFAVDDTDASDVSAIEATFSADWNDSKITAPAGDDLVWSPGSENAMIDLIDSAKSSLDIYNEEMADSKVESALVAAASRGVNVEVVMTNSSSWTSDFEKLKNAGVQVRVYAANAPLYIHAKMILADGQKAFLGSENFSAGSLNDNRELGLTLSDPNIISSLTGTFNADYAGATKF